MLDFLPRGTILEGSGSSDIYKVMDRQVQSNFWGFSGPYNYGNLTIIFPESIKIEGFKLKGVTWTESADWLFEISEKLPDGSWKAIASDVIPIPGSHGPIIDGPYSNTIWINAAEYRVMKIEFRVTENNPRPPDYKLFIEEIYIHRI